MSNKQRLSLFAIVMITVTSVDTIRNLPAIALFGSPLILFFLIGGLFFLIPSALVSSELAAAWPKTGGVYVWVKEAFGERVGFLAIWFQWIENVVWYPTILSFLAGTLAYLISPALATNQYFLFALIVTVFWSLTLINLSGIQASARFSSICGILGLILPMALIISLGGMWMLGGHTLQIGFSAKELIPNLSDPSLLVSITAVVLCFCGMEIATVHAQDADNPQTSYPKALLISVIIILSTMTLGALTIAMTVPHDQLSLVAGIMQAFTDFFTAYHMTWFIPIIAGCIILGSLASVSNWIIAPTRGLQIALKEAELAKFLHHENSHGAPRSLLLYQAVLVTFIALIFLFMPNVNTSYWILTAMAAQLYMGMYILMFAAAIYLRYKCPEKLRPFKIPGGKIGVWIVAGAGMITSIFTTIIGFYPPGGINVGSVSHYEFILVGGLVLMSSPPFVLYWLKDRRHKIPTTAMLNDEELTAID